MNTRNLINGRFSLVSSTWLLALALGATACGAAPDSQGVESTTASADQQDSDAGLVEQVTGSGDLPGPADPGRPGNAASPFSAGGHTRDDLAHPGPGPR